jgi:uncharacterized protein YegP (UPF0339 family)
MKIEVYRSVFAGSAKPEWRWRLRARNGRILASSSESYTKRPWCIRIARRCCRVGTPIVVKP